MQARAAHCRRWQPTLTATLCDMPGPTQRRPHLMQCSTLATRARRHSHSRHRKSQPITRIVFTLAVSDGVAVVTRTATVTIAPRRAPITQGTDALAPGAVTRSLRGNVYAIIPGQNTNGAAVDARVLVADAALAVCVVPGLEVVTTAVLDVADCHATRVSLAEAEAAALQIPNFGSVLYFIDADTTTIRAAQKVYVAPSIGFANSTQVPRYDDRLVLDVFGTAANRLVMNLAFTLEAGSSDTRDVGFDADGQAQIVLLQVNTALLERITLASVDGIAFTGNDADALTGLTEAMLVERLYGETLFALGNYVVQLVAPDGHGQRTGER